MLLSFTPNLTLTSSPIFSWFVGSTSLQVPFSDIFRSFFSGNIQLFWSSVNVWIPGAAAEGESRGGGEGARLAC